MASAGDQNDFNPLVVGPAQGLQVFLGYAELRVQQGAVNIDGNQADGRSHWVDFNSSVQ